MKKRLDQLLVERGLAETKTKSQGLILAGQVFVSGERLDKCGLQVSPDAEITIGASLPYVGRGALKLEAAFAHHGLSITGGVALDVGASTGGFTDFMLKQGARRVYAVDVGYGQLHYSLRNDPRVVNRERVNVRYISYEMIGEKVDLVVIDVSFISVTKIIPNIMMFMHPGSVLVVLVKPQFEGERSDVGKGGIVRDELVHRRIVRTVEAFLSEQGFVGISTIPSPVLGAKGNKEFLTLAKPGPDAQLVVPK